MRDHANLDYRPLTETVSRADVAAFRAQVKAAGATSAATVLRWLVFGFAALVFLLVGGSVLGTFIAVLASSDAASIGGFTVLAPVTFVIVAVGGIVAAVLGRRHRWAMRYRMHRFASVNGMRWLPDPADAGYPGSIFGIGSDRAAYERLQQVDGRLDLGNYRYTTGSGKNRTTHRWGYLAIRLDRRLPQMVLDATANNGLFGATNLPTRFARDQVLKLEGDFNRHFTLYCPREYEQDALYVFTPDLMALLIDNAGAFDVEIVDDLMFVYSASPLRMSDPAVLRRMFGIVDTVGAKTLSRSERYRDERAIGAGTPLADGFAASGNVIAPAGRRLRTGVNGVAVAAVVVVAAFWVWTTFIQP